MQRRSRTAHVAFRTRPEEAQLLRRAAELAGETVSEFCRATSLLTAERVATQPITETREGNDG